MGLKHSLTYEELVNLESNQVRTNFIISVCKSLGEGGTVEFADKIYTSSTIDEFICKLDNLLNKEKAPLFDLNLVYDTLHDEIDNLSITRKETIDNQLNL